MSTQYHFEGRPINVYRACKYQGKWAVLDTMTGVYYFIGTGMKHCMMRTNELNANKGEMKMKQYRIAGYIAFSDRDNFEKGCIGRHEHESMPPSVFSLTANTLDQLLDVLSAEFKSKHFLLNSCETMGRVDLQAYQRKPFKCEKPSKATMAAWGNGEIDLWLTCYTFHVQIIETEIDLSLHTARKYS